MRWEDERYVRLYTRDTPEWTLLSWEARALFALLLRAVDRAGLLVLGRAGLRGVATLLRMPIEVVERAIPELIDDGCVDLDGDRLIVRNFIEAQEAAQSDAARKRTERERARDQARADRLCGAQSVTRGHDRSRAVTTGHPVPSQPSDPDVVPTPRCVADDVDAGAPPAAGTPGAGERQGRSIDLPWLRDRLQAPIFSPLLEEHIMDLAARLVGGGVPPDATEAAISDFEVHGARKMRGSPDEPADLLDGLMAFAARAKRSHAEAVGRRIRPLKPDERLALDLWNKLWSAEHGGAERAEADGDREAIRSIVARARDRALHLGLDRIEPVVRHMLAGYLLIDDKYLVEHRYPLRLLLKQASAIGEYEPKPPKAAARDDPEEIACPPPAEARALAQRLFAGGTGELVRRRIH